MTQSASPRNICWLDAPRLVSIDGLPTGWATHADHLRSLLGQPWKFLALTRQGVRGVLEGDAADAAMQELGQVTAKLDELVTVEVREDVAVLMGDLDDASWLRQACAEAEPVAVFVAQTHVGVAIEAWRRDQLGLD